MSVKCFELKDLADKTILAYNELFFKDTDFEVTSITSSPDNFYLTETELRLKGNSQTKKLLKETIDDLYQYYDNIEAYFEYYNSFNIIIHFTDIENLGIFLKNNIEKIRNVAVNSLYNNYYLLDKLNLIRSMKVMNKYISNNFFTQFLH